MVGFSLGGMIAAELALRWPDHVGGLVLVSARPPSPARVGGGPGILGRALTPPTTDRPLADQFRERWARVSAPGFADRHPERLDEMASAALAPVTPRRTVLAQARAVGAWRGADRLRNLAVPCTVVHGALDPLSPAENSRRLAALIPDARYVELDGVGHLAPQEAPAAARRDRHGRVPHDHQGAPMTTPDVSLASWFAKRAERTPSRRALTFEGRTSTYAELWQRVERLAAGLRAGGLNAGDRVGFLGLNQPAFFETLLAASRLGAIFVPLNFRLTAAELAYIIGDAGVHTLIVDEPHRPSSTRPATT